MNSAFEAATQSATYEIEETRRGAGVEGLRSPDGRDGRPPAGWLDKCPRSSYSRPMAIILTNCPHCGGKSVAFQSFAERRFTQDPSLFVVAFTCGACEQGLMRVYQTGGSTAHLIVTDPAKSGCAVRTTYPSAVPSTAPVHTPDNIARYFIQGADNLKQRNWDAAGTMCRKSVDVSTKALSLEADKPKVLKQRIDALATRGLITSDLQQWAHMIRDLGNDAAHEEEPFTEDEARELHSFTDLYLTYVYTLPLTLAARKASKGQEA